MLAENRSHQNSKVTAMKSIRKVRVIYHDPDLTDSSSDDEMRDYTRERSKKRFVREIILSLSPSGSAKNQDVSVESSCHESNFGIKNPEKKKRVLASDPKKPASGKCRGVRQRKWGKWAAEIRHPIRDVRIWLGTYETEKEAIEVYELKKMEFEAPVPAKIQNAAKTQNVSASEDSQSAALSRNNSPNYSYSQTNAAIDVGTKKLESSDVNHSEVKADMIPVLNAMEEEIIQCEIGQGLDLDMELGSSFLLNDFGDLFDEFPSFDNLLGSGFDSVEPTDVLDFDFELGNNELAWIEEPLNFAAATTCCSQFL